MTKTKNLILLVLLAIFMAGAQSVSVLADPYGSGTYGSCDYGCEESTPPGSETAPLKIVLNLQDGDVIRDSSFTLEATIENADGSGPATNVGWVVFYIDDKLLFTDYTPDSNGVYSTNWPVNDFPGTKVTVVVYDKDGKILARKDVQVVIDLSPAPAPVGTTTTPKSSSPFSAIAAALSKAYQALKKLLSQTPPIVAKSFPYWLFLILLIMAARMTSQAIREAVAAKRYETVLQRERLIAEEKDNFINLSSHYLNTPLTVMRNGSENLKSLNEVLPASLYKLDDALAKMKTYIDSILQEVESNRSLQNIQQPVLNTANTNILKSSHFWFPVGIVAGLSLLSNFLLGVVGGVGLGGLGNMLAQVVVFGLIAVFLFVSIRNRNLRQAERMNAETLLQHEYTIDQARNSLIEKVTDTLGRSLMEVSEAIKVLPETPPLGHIRNGYKRFNSMLAKLNLLSLVQPGRVGTEEPFNMKETVDNVLASYKEAIVAKRIVINQKVDNIGVTQNRRLFKFVLRSIIDNAIKFSREGGAITIAANSDSGKMQVAIEDTGEGIPQDKLPYLFKPFSRTESAQEFDQEGLGFSLFLDKIIMDYLGGAIDAKSAPNMGTVVTVTA